MLYTLRLLAAKRFQRTAEMIRACERIMLEHKTLKAEEPQEDHVFDTQLLS